MKKSIILFGLFLYTPLAFGDCSSDNCSNVYVDKIYVNSETEVPSDQQNALILIGTSGDETKLTCSPGHPSGNSGVYVALDTADATADFIFSTLVTAQASGRPVTIQVTDNPNERCMIEYVTLDR